MPRACRLVGLDNRESELREWGLGEGRSGRPYIFRIADLPSSPRSPGSGGSSTSWVRTAETLVGSISAREEDIASLRAEAIRLNNENQELAAQVAKVRRKLRSARAAASSASTPPAW